MERAVERITADRALDDALAPEVELAAKLLELLVAGAPQGSLYDARR
jgi:hypothetical protein